MLRVDLWPAEALLPDGQVHRRCRVMVTADGTTVVWVDVTGVAKPVYADRPALCDVPERGAPWRDAHLVAFDGGEKLIAHATRPGGCGCNGSPLAHLGEADALAAERALVPAR